MAAGPIQAAGRPGMAVAGGRCREFATRAQREKEKGVKKKEDAKGKIEAQ